MRTSHHPALHPAPAISSSTAAASSRALPLRRFIWSRTAQQSPDGFYAQPAALCEDYPEESTTLDRIRADLDQVRELGAPALRFAFGWDGIETRQGVYHWGFWDAFVDEAQRRSVVLLPYLCYTPAWAAGSPDQAYRSPPRDLAWFAGFAQVSAQRYKGRIRSWELWNEPDLPDYWTGTAEQYASMVEQAARAVRSVDAQAVIVLAGMSKARGPFYDALMERFELQRWIDVVNVHGYLETWGEQRAEQYPARISAMLQLVPAGPSLRPDLWLAEFGYSSKRHSPRQASIWGVSVVYRYEHTPGFQAVALLRDHLLALSTGQLSLTAWYRIRDLPTTEVVIGDDNNKHLGLLDVQGHRKPAWDAFRLYSRLFTGPLRRSQRERELLEPGGTQTVAMAFDRPDGGLLVAAWLRSSLPSEVQDPSGLAEDRRRESLTIRTDPRMQARPHVWHVDSEGIRSSDWQPDAPVVVELQGGAVDILQWEPVSPPR